MLAAIHSSVGELVGEGAAKLTFPVIAERAGVNPTTLYRRWDGVNALLEEVAVAVLTRDGAVPPDCGSLEADLTEWAVLIARDITRPERTRYLRAMVSARTAATVRCPVMEARQEQASEMVDRARARGERTPTVRQVLDHVISPLYHHVAFALDVTDDHPRQLVRDVMSMAR
ncbi:TetR/AcrR family transcriptional regulator [Mycolicibacterium madagascariense]|nr:TetR/AcrR family transcriptional regulator [Mycolicibacterium madagascariense]